MENVKNKRVVFLLSNLAFQAVAGQIGAYSMCKAPLAQTYGYDEGFLGILEAVSILGEIVGSISILFLSLNAVKGYLLLALINSLMGLLLFLPRHLQAVEIRNFLVLFVLFMQSFCVAALGYSQIIFSHYYDENSEKYEHSIWYSITFLGEFVSILVVQYLISLGLQWEWAKLIWTMYMLLIGVCMYFYLDDHTEGEVEIEEILSIEDGMETYQQGAEEDLGEEKQMGKISKKKECCMLLNLVWKMLKQPNIFLVVLSFGLIEGLFVNLLYWVPYYYIQMNEETYSMVSILGCTLCICAGGIILEFLLYQILGLEKYSKNITYSLLLMSAVSYFMLWTNRSGAVKMQIILMCIANFFFACPYNRVSTVDPVEEASDDPHKIKTVFLLGHTSQNLVTAICTLITGFVMKASPTNFWHVILGNVVVIVFVETIRKVYLKGNSRSQISKC